MNGLRQRRYLACEPHNKLLIYWPASDQLSGLKILITIGKNISQKSLIDSERRLISQNSHSSNNQSEIPNLKFKLSN